MCRIFYSFLLEELFLHFSFIDYHQIYSKINKVSEIKIYFPAAFVPYLLNMYFGITIVF